MIVLIPDHCLSINFTYCAKGTSTVTSKGNKGK